MICQDPEEYYNKKNEKSWECFEASFKIAVIIIIGTLIYLLLNK